MEIQNGAPSDVVDQTHIVTDWFGYWPTFHDAYAVGLEYVKAEDAVQLTLHAFEMTDQTTLEGFFILIKHCLVGLRIEGGRWHPIP